MKKEDGFTLGEMVVGLVIISTAVWGMYLLINEIHQAERLVSELNYADQLIEPYLNYYEELEMTEDNVEVLFSDLGEVNLSQSNKDAPRSLRDVDVFCRAEYEWFTEKEEFIRMDIGCDIDGRHVNGGRQFTLMRYVQ